MSKKKQLVFRSNVIRSIRAFFESRDFLEVETALLVPSPGMDLHLDAFEVKTDSPNRYLMTSPEYQMKRLIADGYERIFQIAKVFRQFEFGSRHNPEFTMLEWYRANGTVDDVMSDTEQLVAMVTGGGCVIDGVRYDTRPPFERLTVGEAFARYASMSPDSALKLAETDEDAFFRKLVDEVEPGIAKITHAVFLTEYPVSQASLARKKPGNPRVAERFELYVAGVELCNGFGELVDPVEQRKRFESDQKARRAQGKSVYPIDEKFIDALKKGLPPCGGNAVGVDRLIALAAGSREIAEVIAFADDEL